MSEPTVDPAATPPSTATPDQVVDPARPAATAADTPISPADSAATPDTAHDPGAPTPDRGGYGLGGYLDPAESTARPADDDQGGYVSAKPLLMIGAAGPDVAELGHLLAEHGYENEISRGTADAPPVLDDALMAIVVAFQRDNGLSPWERETADATAPPLLRRDHSGVVDARTWEALLGEPAKVIREGARA